MTVSKSSRVLLAWRANMTTRSINFLYYAAFLSIGGTAGGWALTSQLAGSQAALSFLYLGVLVVSILLMIIIILYRKSGARIIHLILYNISMFAALVWFLSCLILPIFWMNSIDIGRKSGMLLLSLYLYGANVAKGIQVFNDKWQCVGKKLMSRYYDRKKELIDWNGVAKSLKLSVTLYVPGVSERLIPVIYVISTASMFLGLSFQRAFPVFSVFAWGIPLILVNSIFMQMIGFGVAQFLKMSALEKEDGIAIRPI